VIVTVYYTAWLHIKHHVVYSDIKWEQQTKFSQEKSLRNVVFP